jgi:diguanylate cyclase (GGDEF)-like protein/PAS domain S-box-containing protein
MALVIQLTKNQLPDFVSVVVMEKQHLLWSEHVSPEDWENTPTDVKRLVNLLLANVDLSEIENHLAQFLDATLIGIAVHDSTGQLVYINSVGRSLLGKNLYPESEIDCLSEFFQIYHAGTEALYPIEDLPSNRAFRGETVQVSDLEIHRPDRVVPLEVTATPIFDQQGQVIYAIATFQDISDRQLLENERRLVDVALQESELKLSNLTNSIPGAVYQFRLGPEGCFTMPFVSQGIHKLGDISPERVIDDIQVIWDLILPEDWESLQQSIAISAQTLEPWHLEFRIQTANGKVKWILGQSIPHQEEDGAIVWNGILTDIGDRKRSETKRQQAEAALRQSEDRFQKMTANIPGAIFRYLLRPDGSDAVLYMSPGCYRLWEVEAEAVERDAQILWQMIDPEDQIPMYESVIQSAQTLQPWSWSWRITTPSGRQKCLEASGIPERQANGDTIWDTLILDISDRKLVEEKIREQQTQLDLVVEASQIGFYIFDFRTETSIVSPTYKAQLGYTPEAIEASPDDWKDRLHPDDRERAITAYRAFKNNEAAYSQDFRLRHRDGSYRWIQSNAQLICDDAGTPIKIVGTHIDISDRKQAESALQQSEQRFRNLFESTPKISVQGYNKHRQVIYWNDASQQLYGYSKAEAIGQQLEDLIIPQEMREGVIGAVQNWLINGQSIPAAELNLMRQDGSKVTVYSSHVMLTNSEGEQELYCVDIDLSDRQKAELSLRESVERYRILAENINDLVCLHHPDGRYLYVSPSCEALLGYRYDEMLGQDPYTYFHPDDRDRIQQEAHATVIAGKSMPVTYRMRQKSGNYIWFETLTNPIMDATGQVIQLQTTSRDVTERIQAQNQLEHEALHDALTGLPNRNLLIERLELSIHRANRLDNYHFAVLFLDLDRFKVINDSLGHLAGDKLLIAIAQKLQNTLREIDLVARLGGDEFVILLDEIKDIQEAIHATQRIFTALQAPLIIEGREVYTTSSIGIVLGTKDYDQASDLLRDADTAMYRAKNKGKARYEIFDAEMHRQAVKRMYLENDLRQAIDCQEFVLHYQPIVSLESRCLVGFEALMRWQHPSQGLKYPADFIAVAEEIGLITSLSSWGLRTACQQLAAWQIAFPDLPNLKISVNLSVQDLRRSDLLAEIDLVLAQTQLDACCLNLEITESMLIEDVESTIRLFSQLKKRGIQISLDDFGTGYSSLNYLHRLPMDNLKVDRSFVNQMEEGKKNYQIVETIATLSKQLELSAIAEGIETLPQLQRLQELGYQFGQGYLFSKPLSQQAVEDLLENTNLQLFP